jgi:hypothetical protein
MGIRYAQPIHSLHACLPALLACRLPAQPRKRWWVWWHCVLCPIKMNRCAVFLARSYDDVSMMPEALREEERICSAARRARCAAGTDSRAPETRCAAELLGKVRAGDVLERWDLARGSELTNSRRSGPWIRGTVLCRLSCMFRPLPWTPRLCQEELNFLLICTDLH